jgi:hypothetical protein
VEKRHTDMWRSLFLNRTLLVGIVACLVLFRNVLTEPSKYLWGSDFDTHLITWIVEWGYHILIEKGDPLNFWNANSFYPHNSSLAFSDSMLGAGLFYYPLRFAGIDKLSSLYLTFIGITLVGCLSTRHALKRLGFFNENEILIIVILSHFSLCLTTFLTHYQLFAFQIVPSIFLYFYLYTKTLCLIDLILFLISFSLGAMFGTYVAPMTFVLLMLLSPFVFRTFVNTLIESQNKKKFFLIHIPLSLLIGALLYIVQIAPYVKLKSDLLYQPYEETLLYSAKISSLVKGFSIHSFWYTPGSYAMNGDWERAYFPGYFCLFMFGLGFLSFIGASASSFLARRHPSFEDQSVGSNKEMLPFLSFSLFLFIFCLMLSWGPYFSGHPEIKLPFMFLGEYIPGVRNIRAPGRFGAFIGLPLGIFIAYFMVRYREAPGIFKYAPLGVLILLCIESLPQHEKYPLPKEEVNIAVMINKYVPENEPVVQLPIAKGDHLGMLKNVMSQLNLSTLHWRKIVAGYGAKSTPEFDEFVYIDSILRSENPDVSRLILFCKKLSIRYVIIDRNFYGEKFLNELKEHIISNKFKELGSEGSIMIFEVV